MKNKGRSRRRTVRKGWRQRLSSWTAVMLVVAMTVNMPISWSSLGFGISDVYASSSNASRKDKENLATGSDAGRQEDGLWEEVDDVTYRQGKSKDVDIYVIAQDNEVTDGSYTTLTLYLKNNTDEEITDGVLKYSGRNIEKEDGIFTDVHETSVVNEPQKVNPEEGLETQEISGEKIGEVSGEAQENGEGNVAGAEEVTESETVETQEGMETAEEVTESEADEPEEGMETEEEEETEENLHVLTDICLKPGELYEVEFEFYTEEEKSQKAKVTFHFTGKGEESEKTLRGEESFYYSINLPYVHMELMEGMKLEKKGSHEMNIWMSEPSWIEAEEEIEKEINLETKKAEESKEETTSAVVSEGEKEEESVKEKENTEEKVKEEDNYSQKTESAGEDKKPEIEETVKTEENEGSVKSGENEESPKSGENEESPKSGENEESPKSGENEESLKDEETEENAEIGGTGESVKTEEMGETAVIAGTENREEKEEKKGQETEKPEKQEEKEIEEEIQETEIMESGTAELEKENHQMPELVQAALERNIPEAEGEIEPEQTGGMEKPEEESLSDEEKILKYAEEAMAISKVEYEVEIFGTSYVKFRSQKAKDVENVGWISCLYEFAENAKPGIYYGKVSASGKWNKKGFTSQQGFLFEILKPESIELCAELDGMEVIVSGKAEYFPEAEHLELQVEEASEEQEQKAAEVLEKKAEEGKEIPCYKVVNLRLLADGEEAAATEPLDVTFKNMKLARQQEDEEAGIAAFAMEEEQEEKSGEDICGEGAEEEETDGEKITKEKIIEEKTAEEYSIAELQEMEIEGNIEVYQLDEENDAAEQIDSEADEDGAIVIKTKQFSAVVAMYAADGKEVMPRDNTSDIHKVQGVSIPGVNVTMFNYNNNVNKIGLGEKGYGFFGGNKDTTVDTENKTSSMTLVMDPQLGEDGYPLTTNGSMKYLFSDEGKENEDDKFQKGQTMENGGGLFQEKDGYYYYNSAENAAYFNAETSSFTLYDCVIRPSYTNETSGAAAQNFLPFNQILDGSGNHSEYVILDAQQSTPRTGKLKQKVDLWFGMMVEFDFFMPKGGKMGDQDMIFEFNGDDDVFVYIDDYLVLDIGGTHGAQSGTINFATGELGGYTARGKTKLAEIFEEANEADKPKMNGDTFADYTKHKFKFFYMERGGNISYCSLKFNLPTLPNNSLLVEKELSAATENSELTEIIENRLSYKFRVMQADSEGKASDKLFVTPGTSYKIRENKQDTNKTGEVDKDGYFTLKAGQGALFDNMLVRGEGCIDYVVQEFLPNEIKGQYGGVEYIVSEDGGTVNTPGSQQGSEFTEYYTGTVNAEKSHIVTFNNKVDFNKLSMLKVTKQAAEGANFPLDQEFAIQVNLEGEPIPAGTEYTVNNEQGTVGNPNRIVEQNGQLKLKIGETATIVKEILSGTKYEIWEPDALRGEFKAVYSGEITKADKSIEKPEYSELNASGTFPLASIVHVTVTNADYDFTGAIPISKVCEGNEEKAVFNFKLEEVEEIDGIWKVKENSSLPGTSIMVQDEQWTPAELVIGYKNKDIGNTYYYKISEQDDGGKFIYDKTFYIVEVQVSQGATKGTAEVTGYWKNGTGEKLQLTKDGETAFLPFVNQKTVEVIITKTIAGDNPSMQESFTFTAEIRKGEEVVYLPHPTAESGYAVNEVRYEVKDDGTVSFTLQHGKRVIIPIPVGASVTVAENHYAGYYPSISYKLGDDKQPDIHGNKVTIIVGKKLITVDFTNTPGTILPDTGGPGLLMFNRCGWLLLLMALLMAGLEIQFYGERKQKRIASGEKEDGGSPW